MHQAVGCSGEGIGLEARRPEPILNLGISLRDLTLSPASDVCKIKLGNSIQIILYSE